MKLDVKPWVWQLPLQFLPELKPSTWVELLEVPHPFSSTEALLLCQRSEDEWVAWIPDYGEAVLHRNQFCVY